MDDNQDTGPDADALAGETKESEAKDEGKTEDEAKTGTQDEADGESDAGEDAGEGKIEADENDKSDEDEDKPKKQRRLSGSERLKRQNAELRAELANYRSRADRDGEVTQNDIEREIGKPPKEEDFKGDFLAYQNAVLIYESAKFNVSRELRKDAEKAKQAHNMAMQEALYDHEERVAEFRTKVPDFDKVLRSVNHIKPSETLTSLILESDNSAHLVYHLARNPDRLDRLNRMSERDAAREIGRIESRLSLPAPKTETKAPRPPATPPKGGAAPSDNQRDLDAWLKEKYGHRSRRA